MEQKQDMGLLYDALARLIEGVHGEVRDLREEVKEDRAQTSAALAGMQTATTHLSERVAALERDDVAANARRGARRSLLKAIIVTNLGASALAATILAVLQIFHVL